MPDAASSFFAWPGGTQAGVVAVGVVGVVGVGVVTAGSLIVFVRFGADTAALRPLPLGATGGTVCGAGAGARAAAGAGGALG